MGGENTAGADDLDRLGVGEPGLDQLAHPFHRQEAGVPLVGVEDLRVQPEGPQRPDATDAEHDLLAQSMLDVAAVEPVGDGSDLGRVRVDSGVEEVQVDATDVDLPHVEVGDLVGHLDGDLDTRRHQRQTVGVETGEPLLLVSVGVEPLTEVPLGIQDPDADERQAEVGGRLQVVAGQDAETARVLRQGLGEPELG